ncbi:unnamed protein product [Amoebophrya sp. A120]|nr:unnamed protein product [Amoebophrya sp. A120]|eukprot:GSA120T00024852001.1
MTTPRSTTEIFRSAPSGACQVLVRTLFCLSAAATTSYNYSGVEHNAPETTFFIPAAFALARAAAAPTSTQAGPLDAAAGAGDDVSGAATETDSAPPPRHLLVDPAAPARLVAAEGIKLPSPSRGRSGKTKASSRRGGLLRIPSPQRKEMDTEFWTRDLSPVFGVREGLERRVPEFILVHRNEKPDDRLSEAGAPVNSLALEQGDDGVFATGASASNSGSSSSSAAPMASSSGWSSGAVGRQEFFPDFALDKTRSDDSSLAQPSSPFSLAAALGADRPSRSSWDERASASGLQQNFWEDEQGATTKSDEAALSFQQKQKGLRDSRYEILVPDSAENNDKQKSIVEEFYATVEQTEDARSKLQEKKPKIFKAPKDPSQGSSTSSASAAAGAPVVPLSPLSVQDLAASGFPVMPLTPSAALQTPGRAAVTSAGPPDLPPQSGSSASGKLNLPPGTFVAQPKQLSRRERAAAARRDQTLSPTVGPTGAGTTTQAFTTPPGTSSYAMLAYLAVPSNACAAGEQQSRCSGAGFSAPCTIPPQFISGAAPLASTSAGLQLPAIRIQTDPHTGQPQLPTYHELGLVTAGSPLAGVPVRAVLLPAGGSCNQAPMFFGRATAEAPNGGFFYPGNPVASRPQGEDLFASRAQEASSRAEEDVTGLVPDDGKSRRELRGDSADSPTHNSGSAASSAYQSALDQSATTGGTAGDEDTSSYLGVQHPANPFPPPFQHGNCPSVPQPQCFAGLISPQPGSLPGMVDGDFSPVFAVGQNQRHGEPYDSSAASTSPSAFASPMSFFPQQATDCYPPGFFHPVSPVAGGKGKGGKAGIEPGKAHNTARSLLAKGGGNKGNSFATGAGGKGSAMADGDHNARLGAADHCVSNSVSFPAHPPWQLILKHYYQQTTNQQQGSSPVGFYHDPSRKHIYPAQYPKRLTKEWRLPDGSFLEYVFSGEKIFIGGLRDTVVAKLSEKLLQEVILGRSIRKKVQGDLQTDFQAPGHNMKERLRRALSMHVHGAIRDLWRPASALAWQKPRGADPLKTTRQGGLSPALLQALQQAVVSAVKEYNLVEEKREGGHLFPVQDLLLGASLVDTTATTALVELAKEIAGLLHDHLIVHLPAHVAENGLWVNTEAFAPQLLRGFIYAEIYLVHPWSVSKLKEVFASSSSFRSGSKKTSTSAGAGATGAELGASSSSSSHERPGSTSSGASPACPPTLDSPEDHLHTEREETAAALVELAKRVETFGSRLTAAMEQHYQELDKMEAGSAVDYDRRDRSINTSKILQHRHKCNISLPCFTDARVKAWKRWAEEKLNGKYWDSITSCEATLNWYRSVDSLAFLVLRWKEKYGYVPDFRVVKDDNNWK